MLSALTCFPLYIHITAILQLENVRPQMARNIKEFFVRQTESIPSTACSPDLSQIKNTWSMFGQRFTRDTPPTATPDFGSIMKLHGLLYNKDAVKASFILCDD